MESPTKINNEESKNEEVKKEGLRSSSARRLKPSASGRNLRERSGSARGRPNITGAKPPKASPMKSGQKDAYAEISKNELIQII